MTDEFQDRNRTIVDQVADVIAAYVSNNHVSVSDLSAMIDTVHGSLASLENGQKQTAGEAPSKATETQIRKSITPDAIISFIDGKPYKVLKRHLALHGLDAQTYCRRYGLPHDYPMVAASYSERRADISRRLRLGKYTRG